MTKIKQISADYKISMRQIGIRYGIPQRTIEDWSAGKREPPEYVLNLLRRCLEYDTQRET